MYVVIRYAGKPHLVQGQIGEEMRPVSFGFSGRLLELFRED